MWKLTIEDDEGKQTALPLAHDEYGVGRAESNAIRLTDRNVSRKHAVIKRNAHGWIIQDLSSYNGTYLNGNRVVGEEHVASGDVVQLGDYRLELIDESAMAAIPVPAPDARAVAETPAPPVHQRPNRLVVVVGPTPGAEFPLSGDHFTIGRAEEASISINHASISRFHAELIAIGNGRYEVVDKGSANGIRINGVELKRGILEAGDALELGDVRLRFVGAGKIFRAGADQSQQLSAITGLESMATSVRAPSLPGMETPATRGGLGKFIGLGALLGGLVLAGVVAFALHGAPHPAAPAASAKPAKSVTPDEGKAILAAAKDLADKGDIDGAHKKVEDLPEDSPLLNDATVTDIEAKWAQSMFDKVDQATDPGDKKKLLQEISTTPTVDKDTRKKALDQIADLEAKAQDQQHAAVQPGSYNPGSALPMHEYPGSSSPSAPAATAKATATAAAAAPPGGAPQLSDYEQQRKRLEPRVWSGKASEEEIMLLKAMCSHMGDHVCRDRANAMLKKKREQNGD